MDIDKLEAGREMDALVAERVMGWYIKYFKDTAFGKRLKSEGVDRPWINYNEAHFYYKIIDGKDVRMTSIEKWQPSRNISAAWRVVEKMQEKSRIGITYDGMLWVCQFLDLPDGFHVITTSGETPMLAVCRAALRAVEETNDSR